MNTSDTIIFENEKKREIWKLKKLFHRPPYKRPFRHRIHKPADARGNADIIYRI